MTEQSYQPATDDVGAADVAQHAKQAASDVAQHGKQTASEVAGTASDAAKDVVQETKAQASDLLGKSKQELDAQVRAQQGSIVENLRSLAEQLSTMTDHAGDDGTAVRAAGAIRDRAKSAADWLDGRDPADVADGLRTVGRQRPGAFLLGALVAGVAAGRLTRGVVETHTGEGEEPLAGDGSTPSSGARHQGQPVPSPLAQSRPSSLGRSTP